MVDFLVVVVDARFGFDSVAVANRRRVETEIDEVELDGMTEMADSDSLVDGLNEIEVRVADLRTEDLIIDLANTAILNGID